MSARSRLRSGVTWALALAAGPAFAAGLSPSEQRGKAIYFTGAGADGREIHAAVGEAGTEVPAATLPCASCHGPDGQGRPEGGIAPSDITWPALTKPYGVRHASGREHPPYDARKAVRAITLGLDPAGNPLSAVMPRYRLSHAEASDLVAYLQRIADDRDPGLDDRTLTLGLWLPAEGGAGTSQQHLLAAWAAEVNAAGGVFSRELRLVAGSATGSPGERAAAFAAFLDREQPFALVAPHLAGAEADLAAEITRRGVPAIGAIATSPRLGTPLERPIFYLFPGPQEIAAALTSRLDPERRAALARVLGADAAARLPGLAREGVRDVLLDDPALEVGGADVAGFLATAAAQGYAPRVLLPGARAAAAVLGRPSVFGASAFRGELWIGLPAVPEDLSPAGRAELDGLAAAAGLASGERLAAIPILLAAKLTLLALQRGGRNVSREGLITILEGLYQLPTGLSHPVTFGPNQRLGIAGAYVGAVDPASGELRGRPEWVALPP